MRDFLPVDVRKRNYVIGIIKSVYESYGFEPLETPAVENIETLIGKYGEEGNQLVFKILKRGEKLDLANAKTESDLSDLALRYDLTVPLARIVANNKNDLPKFFKRYQIQPVWRADRPARGRFREFYQCDVDAIGSDSFVVETEIISAACDILGHLGFNSFIVKLNHRELLSAILEESGISQEFHTDTLVCFDKIDKIGGAAVFREMQERGIPLLGIKKSLDFILAVLEASRSSDQERGNFQSIISELRQCPPKDRILQLIAGSNQINDKINERILNITSGFLLVNPKGLAAMEQLRNIIDLAKVTQPYNQIRIDPSLARGLSYYTGAIMEIELTDGDFKGSIGGGGRYDGLIGMFGKEQIPACGFSLGLERILVVMEERGMFPPEIAESRAADVMVTIWNEDSVAASLKLATELRSGGLRVTVYPEVDKLGKQFKYADSIGVPFVCVLGDDEIKADKVKLKNMATGEEFILAARDIASKIR